MLFESARRREVVDRGAAAGGGAGGWFALSTVANSVRFSAGGLSSIANFAMLIIPLLRLLGFKPLPGFPLYPTGCAGAGGRGRGRGRGRAGRAGRGVAPTRARVKVRVASNIQRGVHLLPHARG